MAFMVEVRLIGEELMMVDKLHAEGKNHVSKKVHRGAGAARRR